VQPAACRGHRWEQRTQNFFLKKKTSLCRFAAMIKEQKLGFD
jgi:hypothetical protein